MNTPCFCTFKLLQGFHIVSKKKYCKGDLIRTQTRLHTLFPSRFELIEEEAVKEEIVPEIVGETDAFDTYRLVKGDNRNEYSVVSKTTGYVVNKTVLSKKDALHLMETLHATGKFVKETLQDDKETDTAIIV